MLGINSRELSQLVDCGVLDPSQTKQRKEEGQCFFNRFHVERLKSSSIEYFNLVSIPKAAKMLGETYSAFRTNWIRSGHLKIACRYNNTIFLALTEIRAVLTLRQNALTITEAAKALGTSTKVITGFVTSGDLKLIRKSNPEVGGRKLVWRKEVWKLAKAIKA